MQPEYLIGLDLGRVRDYSALCVAERREVQANVFGPDSLPRESTVGTYDITHLERFPLGVKYTDIPDRLYDVIRGIEAVEKRRWLDDQGAVGPTPKTTLIVDRTGVGEAVSDIFRAAGLEFVTVVIHGGDATTEVTMDEWRVPKRELAGVVQVLLQAQRLRIAENLAHTSTLVAELRNFKAKISLTGHDSYGAGEDWREGNHDDLVLAVALACWYGESREDRTGRVGSYLGPPPERGPVGWNR